MVETATESLNAEYQPSAPLPVTLIEEFNIRKGSVEPPASAHCS
ncbi:uncharacterized protein METZ01_LOCUS219362 [marine metagenome]|jgi:hypothetical protein|uniref:Uncharacterized protein n=1 Tax=marine metagenome TaxID=408172 RepID=A0A382FTV6_9ZZZZ|tara:strand:- start:312 stop:443 length:132 start_codon:yes stop_codon:yes gene_type:complete